MDTRQDRWARRALVWAALVTAVTVPVVMAAYSPLLSWREPAYIAAGFAGIIAMTLMLVQPLLAAGVLPGFPVPRGRRLHRWVGSALVLAVVTHVAGLWITSPPDMIDALTFSSPTLFSVWGVVAMWSVFAAALLAALRRRARLRPRVWRRWHTSLVSVAVLASVFHAIPIEGTMNLISKVVLAALVVAATVSAVFGPRKLVK